MEFPDIINISELSKVERIEGTDTWKVLAFPDNPPLTIDDLEELYEMGRFVESEEEI